MPAGTKKADKPDMELYQKLKDFFSCEDPRIMDLLAAIFDAAFFKLKLVVLAPMPRVKRVVGSSVKGETDFFAPNY
jgi:hypothetical protein